MLSAVVAFVGRSEYSSSGQPGTNVLKLNCPFFHTSKSPAPAYAVSNSPLIWAGVLAFRWKYSITARYSILSNFTKTLTDILHPSLESKSKLSFRKMINRADFENQIKLGHTEKKDLIESNKIICLNDFLWFKEMICLNETKFVWFKQNIFGPNKYLFESNKFLP